MAKKAKRGVKPGTKRGPYKKARNKRKPVDLRYDPQYAKLFEASNAKLGETVRIKLPNDFTVTDSTKSVGNLPSLISELQSSISQLEGQLTAQIDRIKSILV